MEELHDWLGGAGEDADAEAIQYELYEIGKRHAFANLRDWFKALYEVLLGQSEGPRFGTFVAIYGTAETRALIEARPRPRGRGRMTERPPDRRTPARGERGGLARRKPGLAKPAAPAGGARRRRHRPRSARTRGGWRWMCSTACSGPDHRPFDETFQGHPQLAKLAVRDRAFARLLVTTVLRRLGQIDHTALPLLRYRPKELHGHQPAAAGRRPAPVPVDARRTPRWPRRCASPPAASAARCRCSTRCCASSRPRAASCWRARTPRG